MSSTDAPLPHWYREELHGHDAMMKRQELRLALKLNRPLQRRRKRKKEEPLEEAPTDILPL